MLTSFPAPYFKMLGLCCAEASCSSQIKTAQAVASEMGEDVARKSGVYQWSKIDSKNSERDVHRVVKAQRTRLNVQISDLQVQGQRLPWINPRAWLQFIISHGLVYMMSGLHFEEKHLVGDVWKKFWEQYLPLHPGFDVPSFNYDKTIALFVHGDEGRTLKRGGLMVTSIQSVLGVGFDQKRLKRPRFANDVGKLHVNFAGHTFLTRFVISVIPKTLYQSNPDLFHDSMDLFAAELRDLLDNGIRDETTGEVWRFVVLGIKGDMPYLQKIGKLKRSWNTTIKRGTQRAPPRGVCHLCLAGTNAFAFEDTSKDAPWISSIGCQPPWDVVPGIVRLLPHDRSHAGSFLRPDLWHCVHLGIGKAFIASTIQIALEVVPASNNDDRFQWLTEHYHRWCRSKKKSSYVSKISAYLVSHGDGPGATGNWSKGSLTTNLAHWIVALLSDLPVDQNGLLPRCSESIKQLNNALSFLCNAPLFLERLECAYVCERGFFFVQSYSALASTCYDLGRPHLFPLFPKLHAVFHTWLDLQDQFTIYNYGLNPLCSSCQMDEDVIGRVSRVSRRVASRKVILRTLQRHLMASWDIWMGAQVLRWKDLRTHVCVCVWHGGQERIRC